MCSIWLEQPFLQLKSHSLGMDQGFSGIIDASIAFGVTIVVLRMHLRDPQLPEEGISKPFDQPSSSLRSPEDNLTLWQFMTVCWMSPLISVGSKKQLSEDDVWSLGHEFQHRLLHDRFVELKGSVTRRLLAANGHDLVITSALAVLECTASKYSMRYLPFRHLHKHQFPVLLHISHSSEEHSVTPNLCSGIPYMV